ncbi:hypothetical protein BX600DRAFT_158507 [Xylariales sp. PMI_506]|nr:hypothetical protein BX600DRAFT_158507 [Xylariales sp. PMI_506]
MALFDTDQHSHTTISVRVSDGEPQSDSIGVQLGVGFGIIGSIFLIIIAIVFLAYAHRNDENVADEERQPVQKMNLVKAFNKSSPVKALAACSSWHGDSQLTTDFNCPLCVICLDIVTDVSEVHELACNHVFHQLCLDDWVARAHIRCPICRESLYKKIATETDVV